MWKLITEAWRYRSVSENYVYMHLGLRYRRNVLGYLWSLLFPILRYGAMGLVFAYVLHRSEPSYFAHFFVGSVIFGFLSSGVSSGTRAILQNSTYIKKLYVPKLLFVFNPVLYELFNTLLVLAGLMVLGLFLGLWQPHPTQFLILPGFVVLCCFLVGVGCLLGMAMVWFNDTQYLVDLGMQTLMFVTPIFFLPQQLPKWLWQFNPFFHLIELIRAPLVENQFPTLLNWAVGCGSASFLLVVGLWVLARNQDKIVFKL